MLTGSQVILLVIGFAAGVVVASLISRFLYSPYLQMLRALSGLCSEGTSNISSVQFWLREFHVAFQGLPAPGSEPSTWGLRYRERYKMLQTTADQLGLWLMELVKEEDLAIARDLYQDMKTTTDLKVLRESASELEDILDNKYLSMYGPGARVIKSISLSEDLGHEHNDIGIFLAECVSRIVTEQAQ